MGWNDWGVGGRRDKGGGNNRDDRGGVKGDRRNHGPADPLTQLANRATELQTTVQGVRELLLGRSPAATAQPAHSAPPSMFPHTGLLQQADLLQLPP